MGGKWTVLEFGFPLKSQSCYYMWLILMETMSSYLMWLKQENISEIIFFFQVLCKWWIKQDGSWSMEVLISSMPLWQHQCAAHLAPPFLQGNTSTTTTPTLTTRTVLLHPGRLSMKYVLLLCTSTTQDIGQVRSRLTLLKSSLSLLSTEANICFSLFS